MLREYFEAKRALLADNPDVDFAIRRALIEDIHECIAVCGDSAGGGLAVMASVWLCDSARELPAAVCAFSPWVDLECRGDSLRTNAHLDAFIAQELAEQLTALYLGPAGSPTDPKANVLHANLGGLPPTFLSVGGHEALLSDAERLTGRLKNAGVEVSFNVWPEQQHVHAVMAGRAVEADEVINAAAAWIRHQWNGE